MKKRIHKKKRKGSKGPKKRPSSKAKKVVEKPKKSATIKILESLERSGRRSSRKRTDNPDDFWLEHVPSIDFKLNNVSTVSPFKFIEEIEKAKRDSFYEKDVKESLEKRKIFQASKKKTKRVLLKKIIQDAGPEWFQDLSFEQMDLVNDLERKMLSDLERRSIDEVQDFFHKLGVVPYVDGSAVWAALKESNGDPVRFLFAVQKVISAREQDDFEKEYPFLEEHRMPRACFSVNERLVLSSVFHYHFPKFIEQLDKILPPPPEKTYVLWGKRKPKRKISYESPYLEPLPINEMCWYEERAEKNLEKKVLKMVEKRRGKEKVKMYTKNDNFSKYAAPLIEQGKKLAEQYFENLMMSEKKKRRRRRFVEQMKKSRESILPKTSWEINCELESMMESEDKFFEEYSISDKDLLDRNQMHKSRETIHSRKFSSAPPNQIFTKMYSKQIPKVTLGSIASSEEDIVEVLRPLLATSSEIQLYNDISHDPTRISGTVVTSQIVEGRLVETRSYGSQTMYLPEYGIIRGTEKNASLLELRVRTHSMRSAASNLPLDTDSSFITHGYFDYTHPCPEQINLKLLLKEIRYDMDYLMKISELQQEESLLPTVVVDGLPIKGQSSIESSLMEVIGHEEAPTLIKTQSQFSRMAISMVPTIPQEQQHMEECPLDTKPYNVECRDEECGIIDDPDAEIPMDEYTLARRKIAALPPEKQLKSAIEYLREKGDALGVLPDIEKVPWLIRWYENRHGLMTDLTQEDKDKLMEESVKIWDAPYYRITNIPIPDFPMKKVVTWDSIRKVKEKAAELNHAYQRKVRQQMVTNARNLFPSMKVEYFKSPLNQSFRRTYFAYEPSKEADCLTIKPWRESDVHAKDDGQCGKANCKRLMLMNQM